VAKRIPDCRVTQGVEVVEYGGMYGTVQLISAGTSDLVR
jgi:hypothetical protein